jgi:hypothetical protein
MGKVLGGKPSLALAMAAIERKAKYGDKKKDIIFHLFVDIILRVQCQFIL